VAKPSVRIAAGKKWTDATLTEFPENDYRLFVGNLDKIITEAKLAEAFQSKYPSFVLCRIIYDKISGTSKGYGFVSLMDPKDCAKAIREMDQSWLGSRPIKVKRSDWKERDVREIRKESNKKRKGARSRRR
jgi:RNA recognition motif-containing protein